MKIRTTGNKSCVSVPTLVATDTVTGCIRWHGGFLPAKEKLTGLDPTHSPMHDQG